MRKCLIFYRERISDMQLLSILSWAPLDYLLAVLVIICVFTDLKHRRIYNLILLPFLLAALLIHTLDGGFSRLIWSLKGLFAGMAILFIPFARGGIGAGDVKLLGVVGAFKGTAFVISVFLTGALAGGLISLLLLLKTGRLKLFLSQQIQILLYPGLTKEAWDNQKSPSFPYALAIGCGVVLAYANIIPLSLR